MLARGGTCPSRGHYLKAKTRKVTLAGCGVIGSILIDSYLRTFQKFYIQTLPVACQVFLLADQWWGHSVVICTFQMATLFILVLAISEDWNVLWGIVYTRHKMGAENKMEELWFFIPLCSSNYSKPNHGFLTVNL